ncbi:MAG: hypothetical protein IRY90_02350 [Actinomadura rubrobrunea]|nr:hypothetical protein [Actinomadura rubrobrunea]
MSGFEKLCRRVPAVVAAPSAPRTAFTVQLDAMDPARSPRPPPDVGLPLGRLTIGVIFPAHGRRRLAETGHAGVTAMFVGLAVPLPSPAVVAVLRPGSARARSRSAMALSSPSPAHSA